MLQGPMRKFVNLAHYWRSMCLTVVMSVALAALTGDVLAVLLASVLAAFAFIQVERRRWIVMPLQENVTEITVRVIVPTFWTYALCCTSYGQSLLSKVA
jgi:hypothetical protein